MFHLRDGFCFERQGDKVRILVQVPVADHAGNWTGFAVVSATSVPIDEFASAVAAVSSRGEDGDTWAKARDFLGPPADPPVR